MDLLLWRHAEAEDGADDLQRRLTHRGENQALAVAAWLRSRQPKGLRIVVSPAARAQQTAQALQLPFATQPRIGPGASVGELIAAAGWPRGGGAVLLIGHQPALGRLASWLLTGHEAEWSVKKAALWWFSRRGQGDDGRAALRAVIPPELLD